MPPISAQATLHDAGMDLGGEEDTDRATAAVVQPCMHGSQDADRHKRNEPEASQPIDLALQRPDGILALLTAALGVPPNSIQSSVQGQEQGQQTPAAKKPRLDVPIASDLSALNVQPQPSQDDLVSQLQQQVKQMQDTFWQRAWQGVQLYLGISTQQEQDAAGPQPCWEVSFPPMSGLNLQEMQALKHIMEPVRHAEVAKTRELLAHLQGLDSAAPAAAALSAAAAPATALAPAAMPLQAARLSSRSGSPTAGLASANAAAAGDHVAAADAAAGGATAAAVNQEQLQGQRQPSPGANAAAWLAAQPDLQAWAGPWASSAAANAMYTMNEPAARQQGTRKPAGLGNAAAAGQQQWGAAQGLSAGVGALGAASSSAGQEGFSLRNPQYVGVYRSRRTEQGWRVQFSYANKVVNLGTYDEAEDAARVWNEAALLLRGESTWLNPVQPPLPEGYVHGELHLSSQKAVAAVQAAAAAAGLPDAVVRGVKLMT